MNSPSVNQFGRSAVAWGVAAWVAGCGLGRAAERGEALRRSVPEAAVLTIEILQPRVLLDPLLSDAFARRVRSLPVWSQVTASPDFQEFQGAVRLFETSLDTTWRAAARELLGGGVLFAAAPGNRAVLLVEATNPQRLRKFHDLVAQIVTSEAAKRNEGERVRSSTQDGVTRWTFDGRETHAVLGSRLVLASDAAVFDRVLATARGPRSASLAANPRYQAARRAVGPDAAAMLFLDLRVLRQAPTVARMLAGPRQQPLGVLLAAGLPTAAQQADWLAVGLRVEGDALVARAVLGPAPAPADADDFTAGARLLPDPNVPGEVAGLRLNRDLHRFYAAKDERFPNRTSGLIFFENMMGIFFSGRDLTDEVFAALQPELNFVIARQTFPRGTPAPTPELPGFALVLRLRDPAAFRPVLEEAWQKALGLINFTRGQKAEPGFIIDRPRHGGLAYTTARFSTADLAPEAQRDIRFNFQPTLAMPGEFAILSSSESLARDLVDALGRPAAAPAPADGVHTRLEVRGPAVAALLRANRDLLIRNNMVEEGHTRAEAEVGIGTLLGIVRQVRSLEFTLSGRPGPVTARLALRFTPAPTR